MERGNILHPTEDRCESGRWRSGRPKVGWYQVCAGVLLAAAFTCIAQDGRPAPSGATGDGTANTGSASGSAVPKAATPVMQDKLQTAGAADNDRRKQISDESTRLLAMAVALKAEVDKTNKDVLSLNVIRRADEIERLARSVKERIKQGSGPG